LGDRGFGRSLQGLEIGVTQGIPLDLREFSTEDLEAMIAILDKYDSKVTEFAESGEIPFSVGRVERSTPVGVGRRHR
jgi:hypothetical protein